MGGKYPYGPQLPYVIQIAVIIRIPVKHPAEVTDEKSRFIITDDEWQLLTLGGRNSRIQALVPELTTPGCGGAQAGFRER